MTLRRVKAIVPWRLKMGAKIALSRLPFGYSIWRRLQLFRHHAMTDVRYAESVFERQWSLFANGQDESEAAILELGPGDSLLSTLLAWRARAKRAYLAGVGWFAGVDPTLYQ